MQKRCCIALRVVTQEIYETRGKGLILIVQRHIVLAMQRYKRFFVILLVLALFSPAILADEDDISRAILSKNEGTLQTLLEAGVRPQHQHTYLACQMGWLAGLRQLLDRGAPASLGHNGEPFCIQSYYARLEKPLYPPGQISEFHHSVALGMAQLLLASGAPLDGLDQDGETVLNMAVQHGNWRLVRYILRSGFDVNARGRNGRTALHALWYSHQNTERILQLLIEAGAERNAQDEDGRTALFYGRPFYSEALDWQRLRLLLESEIDPGIKDKNGDTAADYYRYQQHALAVARIRNHGGDFARSNYQLATYVASENNRYANALARARGILQSSEPAEGPVDFTQALLDSDLAALKLALDNGANPNAGVDAQLPTVCQAIPLAIVNEPEAAAYLISRGANPNRAPNECGETVLRQKLIATTARAEFVAYRTDWASLEIAETEVMEATRVIIDAGAYIYEGVDEGKDPLLIEAARISEGATIALLATGADANTVDANKRTPLFHARTWRIARALLQAGVNPEHRDTGGLTALCGPGDLAPPPPVRRYLLALDLGLDPRRDRCAMFQAALSGPDTYDLVDELKRRGFDANTRDENEKTLLMYAAEGDARSVPALLQHGVDPKAKDATGLTALFYLVEERPEIVYALLEAGTPHEVRNESGETAKEVFQRLGLDNNARAIEVWLSRQQ